METTSKNISRLLEALENSSACSEQEIMDIINHDDEAREAYHLMVAAKQGYRRRQTPPADAESAWQRFEKKHYARKQTSHHWWIRVAAIFVAAAFLGGLAWASYNIIAPKQNTVASTDSIYKVVPVNASFPGGDAKLFEYIKEHLRYPRPCQHFGMQGRIIFEIVVEKDGSITNLKKLRRPSLKLTKAQVEEYNATYPGNQEYLKEGQDIGDMLNAETERVLKQMPKWEPAKDNEGKAVRSYFIVPVQFRLDKTRK